ncbi:MAG: type II toxin-antitoxin system VapC family toxin [Dermatophilaceae bacterium]
MRPLLLDVNVVLALFRADHPHHEPVRRWFDQVLAAEGSFAVPVTVWASFLRLATNRRVFRVPAPLGECFAFVEAMTAQPGHLTMGPGPRHLAILRTLCVEADAVGDLVPDAVLGAVAVEHGMTVATLDRDFARFDSVRHVRPAASPDPGPG